MKGRVVLPLIPGRGEPSDKAEMVTELLYGESYLILENQEKWVLIQSEQDGYECWIDRKQHRPEEKNIHSKRLSALYSKVELEGEVKVLPMASMIDKNATVQPIYGNIAQKSSVVEIAKLYLGTPYRWGGRSPLGIDCSGLVQNAFLVKGLTLPRDAWQQAEIGETISFVSESESGDMAFFDNAEGSITHVGIVIKEDDQLFIIHASGSVRIDRLDHEGIFVESSGDYSHKLRLIKRVSVNE